MSLRWKIMLIPAVGFMLIAAMLIVFIYLTKELHQSNISSIDNKLFTGETFVQISNNLAVNHVRIYDLLRIATEYNDEGKFYDDGKPYLLEIHRLEDLLKSSVDVNSLNEDGVILFEKILKNLTEYRNNTVNAILMASVEQDLANRVLTDSTEQYNELSADILSFNKLNQELLKNEFNRFNSDLERQVRFFAFVFLFSIGIMILFSYLLSKVLSRDLSRNIEKLGELVASDMQFKQSGKVSRNEMATLTGAIESVRRTHEYLQTTRDELDEKQSRLRAIIDNISDAIITIDTKGTVESFNYSAERIFGYKQEDVIGRNVSILMPDPYRMEHDTYINRYLTTGRKKAINQLREVKGRRKDGTVFDLEFTVTEHYLGSHRVFTALLKDITDIKATNTELLNYRLRLEDLVRERTFALEIANKELEAFSYSVSHDLRSPLRTIDGFSMAVLEDYGDKLDEVGIDYLTRVRSCAQDMATLIDDMLQLSRMSRVDMNPEEVDLSKMAYEIIERLHENDPEREVEVIIKPNIHSVGDKGLLKILMENLLGNAWKYTSKKQRAIIEFGKKDTSERPIYYVKDNGAGFDMRYVNKLFSAFHRLHHSEEFHGTGIGLATVQRIVSRHGGRAWAEGEVDKGATFYFMLMDTKSQVVELDQNKHAPIPELTTAS